MNLNDLALLEDVNEITPELLIDRGLIKDLKDGLKILGHGEIKKPLTIKADAFSASAQAKITAAGGKAEVI